MSKKQDFQFGLKNSKIVHASEVESGLKCNCYCPGCGGRFVAYKGEVLRPHFKHQTEVDCKYSFETALHYLAKEIIHEKNSLDLPFINWSIPPTPASWFINNTSGKYGPLNKTIEFKKIRFDRVEIEKWEGNFKPDLRCIVGNKQLLIEIKVTHGINSKKIEKIKNYNTPLLEINLSLLQHEISRKTLASFLYNKRLLLKERIKIFKWVHNPKTDRLFVHQQERSNQIFEFLKTNRKYIKLYGRKKEIYNCPISSRSKMPLNYADACEFCNYNLGKINLRENLLESINKDLNKAVMCIGHKKYELEILFKECGIEFL